MHRITLLIASAALLWALVDSWRWWRHLRALQARVCALTADVATTKQAEAESLAAVWRLSRALTFARSKFRDFAANYDCDADAHTHGTPCRACLAQSEVEHIDDALRTLEKH